MFPGNRRTGALHDATGNQTAVQNQTFTYDGENRLIQAVIPITMSESRTITYAYDGEGRRVKKTMDGAATIYVYDAAGQLTAECGGEDTDGGTQYMIADHLGSTRLLTDAAGTPVRRFDYLPFGEELPAGYGGRGSEYSSGVYPTATPDAPDQKFTGKERDGETGLDYFGARYFSAAQGRFTSTDPIQYSKARVLDPQQWNMYAYARGNPLSVVDPTGQYNTTCKEKDIKNCSQEIQDFEARRQKDLQSKSAKVRAAAAAYGGFNDGNNVSLRFDPNLKMAGQVRQDRANGKLLNSFTVTFRSASDTLSFGGDIAHEGSHLMDDFSMMKGGPAVTRFQSEIDAYKTTAGVIMDMGSDVFLPRLEFPAALNNGASMTLYDPDIPLHDQMNESSIKDFLAANPAYGLTPKNQGGPVYKKPTRK